MAEKLVKLLDLSPHPYGGFFKQIHTSAINVNPLDDNRGARSAFSSIYVVMRTQDVNPWHRLKSDESLFFHKGASLKLYLIDKEGQLSFKILGDPIKDPSACYAHVLPADAWLAGELINHGKEDDDFSFFSASLSPGFHMNDSENASIEALAEMFPKHRELIERLGKKANGN